MGASTVTGPTVEPVTLAEARTHLRITSSDLDAQIAAQIIAARMHVENTTRRALLNQTVDFTWDYDWPQDASGAVLVIPLQPLVSVTSLTYVPDGGGTASLTPTTHYQVVTNDEFSRIVPAYDYTWPAVRCQPNAITVRAVVGYGATASSVPEPLRQAILLHVELLHDRDPLAKGVLEAARDTLMEPYRVVRL